MIYKLWCLRVVAWSLFCSLLYKLCCCCRSKPVDAFSFLPFPLLSFPRWCRVGADAVLLSVQPLSVVLATIRPNNPGLIFKIGCASCYEACSKAWQFSTYQWKVPMPSFLSSTYSPLYFLPSGHSKTPVPSILLFFHSPLYWRPSDQL